MAEELKQKENAIKLNDKENNNPVNSGIDTSKLQAKNEALEKKLRKYIAHSECLTKEKELITEIIKENISDSDSQQGYEKDVKASVVSLCERLNALEEEYDSLNAEKSALLLTLSAAQGSLEKARDEKAKIKDKFDTANQEIAILNNKQKQLQDIAEVVRDSAKDLEEEKNRQVSYLEKENLHILEENKKLKKDLRTLKTQRKAVALAVDDEKTEDLGSILSLARSSNDKENTVNNSSVKSLKANVTAVSKSRVGLGSGEGEADDENTQECQTS